MRVAALPYATARLRFCFTIAASTFTRSFIARNNSAVTPMKAICGARDFSQSTYAHRPTPRSLGPTEKWDIIGVLSPEGTLAAERVRRRAFLDESNPGVHARVSPESVCASDQSSSHRQADPRKRPGRMRLAMKCAP